MTTPVPGGRLDGMQRAADAATPGDAIEAEAEQYGIEAVPVSVRSRAPALNGRYATAVLPASTSAVPAVRQVLSRDDVRRIAYLIAIDNPVVIATTLEEAQAAGNAGGAAIPSGAYLPVGLPVPVTHSQPVWAVNTSTSATSRVAILTETGQA